MTKSKQYFDVGSRDEQFEKSSTLNKSLNESWKKILTEGVKGYPGTPVKADANKGAKKTGDALLKSQKVTPMKEADTNKELDPPAVEEPKPEDTPVDAAPAPEVPAGEVPPSEVPPPAPIDTAAPEAGPVDTAVDPELAMKTDAFIQKSLTNLPSDIELKADQNGVFKGVVNDEQEGSFVVVVYPSAQYQSIHDVANIVEPKDAVPAGDIPGDIAAPAPEVPAGDVTPPVDAAAPAPEVPAAEEPAPVEEPKEDEEIKESKNDKKEKECEYKKEEKEEKGEKEENGEKEDEEDDEKKMEESRDPCNAGKKDWKKLFESRYSPKK